MEPKTLVIDNFKGSMTAFLEGDINSGLTYVVETFGNDPFSRPGNLTWCNASEQIDPSGSVITDLIMAGKERIESGIIYVYAIGHTGRLYKIQVNDPTTFNPDYDNPTLVATLATNSPTFTRGGFIDFFGATEKIYIGHDKGVTSINFDGTGEAFVGSLVSWTQTVPRPLKQFLGKLYIGNGTNIAEIDSTATVTTYTKLSPAFPSGTQTRDIDVTPDGNYIQVVVTRLDAPNLTSATQDTTFTSNSDSYIFKWNGTDVGYTSYDTFPTFSLTANTMFQNYQYTFGYDLYGAAVYAPTDKRFTLQEVIAPSPNAVASTGNLLVWMSPLSFGGFLEADILFHGTLDFEVGPGYWDLFGQFATGTETDVVTVPYLMPVSNFGIGSSSNGYTNGIVGQAKFYFSTLETSSAPTTDYKLYKWTLNTSPSFGSGADALEGAVYQTQSQFFSKKVRPTQIRVYGDPWDTGASFTIDLIGSAATPISGGSKTFVVGSNLTAGDDYAWYTPQTAPTYAIGLRITNAGTVNHVINKIEIDYVPAGQ